MSAWYVLSSMGFYSVCPGQPVYELGCPQFDRVVIHLENGKDFTIRTRRARPGSKYIHSLRLNGKQMTGYQLPHDAVEHGGELLVEMGE